MLRIESKNCPAAVEVGHVISFQRAVLEVALHGVQLRHGIGNRRTCGEDHTASAGQLVHIPAFQEHVCGLLRFAGGKAGDVAHLRHEEPVLESVGFIHKQPVHAQLFESNHVVLALLGLQLPQATFQLFLRPFQLLDGELFSAGRFQFLDAVCDFVDMLLYQPSSEVRGNFRKPFPKHVTY